MSERRVGEGERGRRVTIVVALLAALVGFCVVALLLWGGGGAAPAGDTAGEPAVASPARPERAGAAAAAPATTPATTPAPLPGTGHEDSILMRAFGADDEAATAAGRPQSLAETLVRVTLRLTLAALLAAMLAFRPRRYARTLRRNPFVAQTQILLAVVASALMMIVGDSAARAFGIFAAASLVRFRTNIRDPKETTVLLVSLAIGLGTGVGRWELALILSFFVLLLLWGLEYREQQQIFRAMDLEVKSRNIDRTQEALLAIFKRHNFRAEVRTLNREDAEDPVGCVVYSLDLSPFVSTDQLSEEILAADPENIDSVEWDQRKSTSYIYQ